MRSIQLFRVKDLILMVTKLKIGIGGRKKKGSKKQIYVLSPLLILSPLSPAHPECTPRQ